MTEDPVLAAVQRFIDAVESRLGTLTGETRSLLTEARSALGELQTRAATSGPAGKDGAPGRDGLDGKDGRDGTDGARGDKGDRGEPGERGADGIAGRDGAMGLQGQPGERGAQGERGADGLAGRDGAPGPQGERGADGVIGPAGPMGERGADGLAGRDGAPSTVPGPMGPQGERGADGIATRAELDALIEARFAELQVRTLADSWRGVWSPTEQYQRGNVAQWDGSPWLALADRPTTKPGTSPDWVLFAKKGRDGSRMNGR